MAGTRNRLLFRIFVCVLAGLAAVCYYCGTATAAPAKRKPTGVRPTPTAPPGAALPRHAAPTKLSALRLEQSVVAQSPGSTYSNSPPPSASFEALLSDGSAYDPGTHGAVGPAHMMVMLNTEVRVQDRSGSEISRTSLEAWWKARVSSATNVFDPRVVYDPYGGRFIATANNDPGGPNPGLLVAVSATSNPTGAWYGRKINISTSLFADLPTVGFNRHWIIVSTDTYTNASPYGFANDEIYVFNKTNFYAGNVTATPAKFSVRDTASIVPVVTYDATNSTSYLVANYWGNLEGSGWLSFYSVTGPVNAPVFTALSAPTGEPWADYPNEINLAPQLGSANKIALGDSRITSATYRGGTIQAAHTVFLPVDNPTHAAVQWWEFDTLNTWNLGRIEDASGVAMYAFPSIAANRNNDIAIGFSRFSPTEYPSAAYAYRADGEPADTIRGQVLLKAGNASYYRTNSFGDNLWGKWSATMIDPLNDSDFWTIQEYAEFPNGPTSRWGTWWDRISPANDLALTVTDSPDPVVAGSNLTYSVTVTNLFSASVGGVSASGVRISNALPANFSFVSASASQGTCSFSDGVVICDLGTLTNLTRATATIVVRAFVLNSTTNVIAVHANGPDADYSDNSVAVTTTLLPSADVAVLLAESQDPVTVGNDLTYTVAVTNRGPAGATLVSLTNTLPASCTFVSAVPSIGTCANSGGIVNCSLGSLNNNAVATVLITARPNTGGITISNRARVVTSSIDAEQSNNSDFILTYVNARPTISSITNRVVNEDTTTPAIAFTIGDLETAVGNLVLDKSSSDTTIVPTGNIQLGGSGANRNVTITPAPNMFGTVTITIYVTDEQGATSSEFFTLTVNSVNDVPTITAIPNPPPIDEDTSTAELPFTIGDVETAVDLLTVTGLSSNPTLVPTNNIIFSGAPGATRTVRVIPATNQTGTATITVRVSDGLAATNGTFVVTVNGINDPPVISTIGDRATNEDTPTAAIPFTIIDVENIGNLTLTASSSNPGLIPTNNIVFGGLATATNRTVTLTPVTNQFGSAVITITVSDGTLTDSTTFNFTVNAVNDSPTINPLSNITTNEDAGQFTVPLSGITSGAANEDQPLTVTVSNSNPALISVVLNYNPNNTTGSLLLTTVADAVGSSTITVTVRDDGTSNNIVTRSFAVTLTGVNDAPTISDIGEQFTDEDVAIIGIPFQINDLETAPTNLTLSVQSSAPAIIPIANVTWGGTGTDRTLNIRPATNQFGQATITLTVSDGVLTASTVFQVNVNSVNDAPRFVVPPPDRGIQEDTLATINFTVGDVDTAVSNLVVTAFDSSNPILAPLSNISFGSGTGSNRTVFVMPATNEVGSSTITLRLSDGISNTFDSFVLTVTNVNDAPRVLTPIPDQTIDEDTSTATLSFVVDDKETPAGNLIVTGSSSSQVLVPNANIFFGPAGSATRTVRVVPATNQFGTATITINVSDGVIIGSTNFQVTVRSVNDYPTISAIPNITTNEDFAATAPFIIRDVETLAANLTLQATSSNPEVVDDSGITFGGTPTNRTVIVRPLTNQVGTATITITVSDPDGGSAQTDFEVTFNEVNDRPTISNLQNLTVAEDTNAVVIQFTIDDPETLPQSLTLSATSTNLALVPTNNLTLGGAGANRTLTIVPASNRFGTTLISVFVSDGSLTATGTFVLTVTAVNDAPTITGIADQTILEDTTTGALSFTIDDVESAETNLNLSATSSNPTLIPNVTFGGTGPNRTVTARPATNQFGSATITVTVNDGALSNSVSFVVNVIPVNDPPTLNPIGNLTIGEDAAQQTVNFNGVSSGAANEVQALTVTARSSNPSLIPDPLVTYTSPQTNGTLRLTPAGNASGSATISVTVRDDGTSNNIVTRTFTVTVNAVNDAPTISTIPTITTGEDTPVSADITVGDIETPVSALTLSGTCANATLLASSNITFHGSGAVRTMVLVPTPNQFGTSTVTVAVSDGTASVSNSFTFVVIATNDAPTLDPIRDVFLTQSPGITTITLTGIGSGAGNEAQNLTFSNSFTGGSGFYFSGNTPSISYTNPNTTATLTFRPANNQTGTSMVTVVVRETNAAINALTSRSFTIYVKPTANTAPTISTITNRTILEDTSIAIPFVINDAQTPVNLLSVSAFTTNLTLLPPSSFVFSGTGTNRTLTITPATNQSGLATVTVSVMDTNFGGASTNFVLTVTPFNDLPVISGIASQTIQRNGSTPPVPFTVGDLETAAGTLTLSATSSNPTLVPVANVVFGGSGTNRAVTVTPATGQAGTATITVTVRDANAGTASTSFDVTVVNPSPTPLAIVRSGGTVILSWSASAGSFILQSCSPLGSTWTDIADPPVLFGGSYRVTQAIDSDVRLYRLRVQ